MAVYYDVFDIGCTGSKKWKIHEGVVRCCTATLFQQLKDCLHLAARHRIKPMIEIRKMECFSEGYRELAEGRVEGRIVFQFWTSQIIFMYVSWRDVDVLFTTFTYET